MISCKHGYWPITCPLKPGSMVKSWAGMERGLGSSLSEGQIMKNEKCAQYMVILIYIHFCECIGRFVSCLALVCAPDCAEGFLVSGSGDSTVSNIEKIKINYFRFDSWAFVF